MNDEQFEALKQQMNAAFADADNTLQRMMRLDKDTASALRLAGEYARKRREAGRLAAAYDRALIARIQKSLRDKNETDSV